jgi:uncharacterized protein (TIGR00730 family)
LKSPSETNITPLKPVDIQRVRKDEQTTNGAAVSSSRALRNVCVYCGSGVGENPIYAEAAHTLGRALGENGIGLVYGGGGLGLMGEVARAALAAGGSVTGIIPEFLTVREHMLREVTDLIVTRDMHERKRQMYERSDAFVALPGGIGTLEELVEQLTWSQLGQHSKPIVVANIADFWTPFLNLLAHMRKEAFIRPGLEVRFGVVTQASEIVPRVQSLFAESVGEHKPSTLIKF